MFDIDQFVKDRDAALLSLDKGKIMAYMRKYGIGDYPKDETIFWAGVNKAVLGIKSATAEQKERSRCWLVEHGFTPGIE